jgi:hypothetical protein
MASRKKSSSQDVPDVIHEAEADIKPSRTTVHAGMTVPVGTQPPDGWQMITMDNGTVQLWPVTPKMFGKIPFDPEIRRKTMKRIFSEYEKTLPTPDDPDRGPGLLLVNPEWRALFPHVQEWGETSTRIMVTEDRRRVPGEGPNFKFIQKNNVPEVMATLNRQAALKTITESPQEATIDVT